MTQLPVLTAAGGGSSGWELGLVAATERRDLGITVVRRCVDLADLLAAAATGAARAVVLAAGLRRLDRDALVRLGAAGLAVVGLSTPGDESEEQRLRQLGVTQVLSADAAVEEVAAAVVRAVAALSAAPVTAVGWADPADAARAGVPDAGSTYSGVPPPPTLPPPGRLVAVWGPTGAPGRTTVAITLAAEAATLGVDALLVDADVYGGAVAQLLGLLEEAPGLAAAARAAGGGGLDVAAVAGLAREVGPRLRVLPGILRADRWTELRPAALEVVLEVARRLARLTVLDCGFCLEAEEELSFDTVAPRRNGATVEALGAADTVVAVGSADPVGLQRLVRGLGALREAVPDVAEVLVVANRQRDGAGSAAEVTEALRRHAGVVPVAVVPLDIASLDRAVRAGRPLGEVAPGSPARAALLPLAARLAGVVAPPRGRRRARHQPRG